MLTLLLSTVHNRAAHTVGNREAPHIVTLAAKLSLTCHCHQQHPGLHTKIEHTAAVCAGGNAREKTQHVEYERSCRHYCTLELIPAD